MKCPLLALTLAASQYSFTLVVGSHALRLHQTSPRRYVLVVHEENVLTLQAFYVRCVKGT
jgi:hypothetical protein